MKSSDVRKKFLGYFEKHGHRIVPSSRLVPDNDPTILFTNAGMNQFKNVFTGLEKRDYTRAASSQKCVRAGGKHNDLENVGFTARHHTFFEMLGNFSFGDYFKKDAIHFAWDLITREIGLPKDKLYVTVFQDDDEAADIWHKQEGVPRDRIYRFGEKDNFWRMGNSGPCGPCSEIFYDLGPEVGGDPKQNVMGGEGDRYIEFWNLVFMQYNESEDGKRTALPKPSVDTGMGLERLSTILQGKLNNFDNDLFQSLIHKVEKVSGVEYVRDLKVMKNPDRRAAAEMNNVAMRVLADHARATAFLIADGVLPSNDGRGYVLRRIMRRAIRYGRNLKQDVSILPAVVEEVITEMGAFYDELVKQKDFILTTTRDEERRFFQTLDQGTHILTSELERVGSKGLKVLDGKTAFKLYDTFGFPLDLTKLIARERGFDVDEASFDNHFQEAREVAKSSWKGKGLSVAQAHVTKWSHELLKKTGPTEFLGYGGVVKAQGKVVGLSSPEAEVDILKTDMSGIVVLDRTCFYAESGGQVGDTGVLVGPRGQADVLDCTKMNDIHLLHVRITDGEISSGDTLEQQVNESARRNTAAHHSATHLLHSALRRVLGTHVTQAGSLVAPDKLRFDFTHNGPVTAEQLMDIENLVNAEISKAIAVETRIMAPKEAIAAGAMALFGEKYGDKVRVLRMGDFSTELCGGTHVDNTAFIRLFKIVGESGVSAGVRRIEALTADPALKYVMKYAREDLKVRQSANIQEGDEVLAVVERLRDDKKHLEKEIQSLKGAQIDVKDLVQKAFESKLADKAGKKVRVIYAQLPVDDRQLLSQLVDKARDMLGSGVVAVMGAAGDSSGGGAPLIVSVSKDLAGQGPLHAGKLLGELAALMGGKGGGRPDFAQGAAKDPALFEKARSVF